MSKLPSSRTAHTNLLGVGNQSETSKVNGHIPYVVKSFSLYIQSSSAFFLLLKCEGVVVSVVHILLNRMWDLASVPA